MTDHDYTVHVQIKAATDDEAWNRATAIAGELPVSVTDSDDWAEHVDVSLCCAVCGGEVDRERVGTGRRTHHECADATRHQREYPIADLP